MPAANFHGSDTGVEPKLTWARFVPLPENRAALDAAQRLADELTADRHQLTFAPLTLHGPPGVGKSHLVWALTDRLARTAPHKTAQVIAAGDWDTGDDPDNDRVARLDVDLLVIDDLQRLPSRAAESLVQVLDRRSSRNKPTVFTATEGPQRLDNLPARLSSRLAGGLVVALALPGQASRVILLTDKAQRRHLALTPDVIHWLAEHLTGPRQLEGALTQLELLGRLQKRPLDVAAVARHFRETADRPTVEHIVHRVGGYFQVDPRDLQSTRRHRNIVLPRQVGMYLARQLTDLSLADIGAYFGGRDHSTVLHACRKVEAALVADAALDGAVRQLRAGLS